MFVKCTAYTLHRKLDASRSPKSLLVLGSRMASPAIPATVPEFELPGRAGGGNQHPGSPSAASGFSRFSIYIGNRMVTDMHS